MDVVHRYGDDIDAALIKKLRQNARRNFGVTLSSQQVESLARHFQEIYAYGASILTRFIQSPPRGRFVDPSDVRTPKFLDALARKFPRDSRGVRELISWYVVHYEYLR